MSSTKWADASWNPIRARERQTGKLGWHCEIVSPGCEHCYAEAINHRLGTGDDYLRKALRADIVLDERLLSAPLRWRRPRRIFVGSMTDLSGDWVTDEMLDRIFAVMALCPQHTFLVLTKRAERMRDYLSDLSQSRRDGRGEAVAQLDAEMPLELLRWPLPNVWAGVSVEDQRRADERIPLLLDTPAAVRWISAEPLLGPIDLRPWLNMMVDSPDVPGYPAWTRGVLPSLDWVVCGGESGPGARPMLSIWARSLRDQCTAAAVPFFFKQWGEWIDADEWLDQMQTTIIRDGQAWRPQRPLDYDDARWLASLCGRGDRIEHHSDGATMIRIGKRAAGRRLAGREWNEYPAAAGA